MSQYMCVHKNNCEHDVSIHVIVHEKSLIVFCPNGRHNRQSKTKIHRETLETKEEGSKWSKHFRDMQWSWKTDVHTNRKRPWQRPCMRCLPSCCSMLEPFVVQSPLIKAADLEIHLFLQSVVSSSWGQWHFIDDPSLRSWLSANPVQDFRLLNWCRLSWKTAQQIEICFHHHVAKAAVTHRNHVCDAPWIMKCTMDDLPCG